MDSAVAGAIIRDSIIARLINEKGFPVHSLPSSDASIISGPSKGKYAYLSEAITEVKPMIPIVGNIAIKKNSQPVSIALVHRRDMSSSASKIIVPIMPADIAGFAMDIGSGRG